MDKLRHISFLIYAKMTIKKGCGHMKKIGGVNMNAIARLTCKLTKDKTSDKRYCSVYESLKESLKEVKLIKEGKIKPKTWRELLNELNEDDKE